MSVGVAEIAVVVVVALLVFGPERLPEFARETAKFLARFRSETAKSVEELKRAANVEDLDRELRGIGKDLRDVRSSVTRALTAESSGRTPSDRPPPMDPEAT